MISRREFLAGTAGLAAVSAAVRPLLALSPRALVTVYKSSACKCCAQWVEHLQLNGFRTEAHDLNSHVPADDIQRLLEERPKVAGLAVPGMPESAPGMYQPGDEKVPYEVLAYQKSGTTSVYAKH